MANIDDQAVGIARVYCRSLMDLAVKQDLEVTVLDELGEVTGLMDRHPELARFLSSPLIDGGERAESLERMFRGRLNDLLVDTLQVLNRKERLPILPTLHAVYRQELEARRGQVRVRVTTAVGLADDLRGRLNEALASITGKVPKLEETVDPSILGGLVVRVGDRKFDGSVHTQIEKLRHILHERGRQQIYKSRAAARDR